MVFPDLSISFDLKRNRPVIQSCEMRDFENCDAATERRPILDLSMSSLGGSIVGIREYSPGAALA